MEHEKIRTTYKTPAMKRPSYGAAVNWIAYNDDSEELELEGIAGYLTTALVADLFGKDRATVAKDVLDVRLDDAEIEVQR